MNDDDFLNKLDITSNYQGSETGINKKKKKEKGATIRAMKVSMLKQIEQMERNGKADSRAIAIKKILNSNTDFDAKKLAKI